MWGDVGGLPGSESGIYCAAVVGGIGGKAHTFLGNLEPCVKRGAVDCSASDVVVDNRECCSCQERSVGGDFVVACFVVDGNRAGFARCKDVGIPLVEADEVRSVEFDVALEHMRCVFAAEDVENMFARCNHKV